jgi:tetratricopeptide (TPR) repeat protein
VPACHKQEARVEEAEAAFKRARELDTGRARASQMLRLHAHMCQGLGRHDRAAALLGEALEVARSPSTMIEILQLKGAATLLPISSFWPSAGAHCLFDCLAVK